MPTLNLTPAQSELFLGGLLAVARADGTIDPDEMRELRAIAAEHELALPPAEDLLFMPEVAAGKLAGAGLPGEAYLLAALRVAQADGELVAEEVAILRAMAAALGCATDGIPGWSTALRYHGEAG